jgi:hypothetical protein
LTYSLNAIGLLSCNNQFQSKSNFKLQLDTL